MSSHNPQLKLYNTLTRTLQPFTPQDPRGVKVYTCGPTVYSYAHIGNFASYIYWDLLVRTLRANGYHVRRTLNLTDVGHLSSDADEGEDKLEKGARREGKTVWEIADHYATAFMQDFHTLRLAEPQAIAKATDYIKQDLALINRLTEQGYTYQTSDGIYFDTSKFPTYADFARLDLDHLRAGARVDFNSEKRNLSDFALWKFIQPGEDHAMRWDYLGRPGYPGWHIECSTIAHETLGETLDIHTGGIDHIPVHHTNEIAQSEAAYGKPLANYWLHSNFLTVEGQKISKSLDNTYTLADLKTRDFDPLDFKIWTLQGHYQSERNFSFSDLSAAKQRHLNWRNAYAELQQLSATQTPTTPQPLDLRDQLLVAVNDNLNSAAAFSLIDETLNHHRLNVATWEFIDNLFGLDLTDLVEPTPEVLDLIAQREQARERKDYATADQLRDQLFTLGYAVKDTPAGPIWQYA